MYSVVYYLDSYINGHSEAFQSLANALSYAEEKYASGCILVRVLDSQGNVYVEFEN